MKNKLKSVSTIKDLIEGQIVRIEWLTDDNKELSCISEVLTNNPIDKEVNLCDIIFFYFFEAEDSNWILSYVGDENFVITEIIGKSVSAKEIIQEKYPEYTL